MITLYVSFYHKCFLKIKINALHYIHNNVMWNWQYFTKIFSNIPLIQTMEYCRWHILLLWVWKMLCCVIVHILSWDCVNLAHYTHAYGSISRIPQPPKPMQPYAPHVHQTPWPPYLASHQCHVCQLPRFSSTIPTFCTVVPPPFHLFFGSHVSFFFKCLFLRCWGAGVHEALFLWKFSSFKARIVGNDGSTASILLLHLFWEKEDQ